MSKKRRRGKKPGPARVMSAPREAPEPTPKPVEEPPRRFAWIRSPWLIVAILLLGAGVRLWGVTERHYLDPDATGQFMGADMYRVAWEWHRSEARETQTLLDYAEEQLGTNVIFGDNGKPLNLLFRAGVIFLTGTRSITAHSVLDTLMALLAMGLMLRWCHKTLGARMAFLAGALWLVGGAQLECTGRGYDYSAMTLFGTLAWLAFMQRAPGRIYRKTFFAGLWIGIAFTYHYSFFNYIPLYLIFILLFRNPDRIIGKIRELVTFVVGLAAFPLVLIVWYRWLSAVTRTTWTWEFVKPLFQSGNTFGDITLHPKFFANAWFVWHHLNGYLFMLFLFVGLVAIAVLHVREYRWRWSICDDPLFVLAGITAYGMLVWGLYHHIVPRVQMPEIVAWPIVAAVGVHQLTRLAGGRLFQGRAVAVMQLVLVPLIMIEQWQHTAPLVKMGAGIRKAMVAITEEGKTAVGEGVFWGTWPCTSKPLRPVEAIPPLTRWECLDDFLETNEYDYFYVFHSRILTHMVMYPGAGHPLMLSTYQRLFAKASPVWRFECGAALSSRIENMNIGWLRQQTSMETWRKHQPQPTPYDGLVARTAYFDVYRADDAIRAFRETRLSTLAQLLVLQQRDPGRFQQVAPRFHNFIQYNTTNAAVMAEARDLAARM